MKELYLEPIRYSNNIFTDERGSFSPLVLNKEFPEFNPIQVNTVLNYNPYTFRGLHWQEPPYAQAKLIRCIFGKIIDFAVDIRVGSPNFGKSYEFTLDDENNWVYIPEGFAHGYMTLPHNLGKTYPTVVEYLVNNDYNKESERGIFITPDINDILIREIPMTEEILMNERDRLWPTIYDDLNTQFKYEADEQ